MISSAFFWSFYLIVLIWFLQTDVRLLAGISSEYAQLILGLCLVIMVSIWALVSLPFAWLMHTLRSRLRSPSIGAATVLISGWLVLEWLRSLSFSIFLYAPGASIGDYWNFGSLGLSFMNSPFAYLARIVGMYGLSAIVVSLALTIVWASNRHLKPLLVTLPCLISFILVGRVVYAQLPTKDGVSATVHQYTGQANDISEGFTDIKYKSSNPKALVVLAEYSRIHSETSASYAKKYVSDRLDTSGISIDAVADFTKPLPRFNTLLTRDKAGAIIDTQTKQLLIPTGEYLPGIVQIFYKLTGQDSLNQNFADTKQLSRGQPPRVIRSDELTIAPVACSGILGRNIYRQLVNDGGEVLTNSASLVIFNGSQAYFRQSLQMARFHAVANDKTYIQASMGAPAFVIANNGSFIVAPEDTKTAFIDFSFQPNDKRTLYTRFGDWPLIVAAGFLVTAAGYQAMRLFLVRRKS